MLPVDRLPSAEVEGSAPASLGTHRVGAGGGGPGGGPGGGLGAEPEGDLGEGAEGGPVGTGGTVGVGWGGDWGSGAEGWEYGRCADTDRAPVRGM